MFNRWGAGLQETGACGAGRGRTTRPASPLTVSAWKALLLAFLAGGTSGCYVYQPLGTTATPGQEIALDLNDRGRVGLGESIGPAAERIEGSVKADSDSAYELKVTSVGYLNGQSNPWTGESLMIRKDFVREAQERKFSRGRTFFVAAVGIGAVAAFAISRGLVGGGSVPVEPPPPPPPPGSFRGVPSSR